MLEYICCTKSLESFFAITLHKGGEALILAYHFEDALTFATLRYSTYNKTVNSKYI